MFAWNVFQRLLRPDISVRGLTFVMRVAIALLGAGAVWMALKVQSVQALWFFTSDLVFVLLFPQLVAALFDPKANLIGSIAAFFVSLVLADWWRRAAVRHAGADCISVMASLQDSRGRRRDALAADCLAPDGFVECATAAPSSSR